MLRTRWPVVAFVAWSVFLWVTRINNALADDTANKPFAVVLSLSVLVPVAAVAVTLVQARRRAVGETEARLWVATAGWVSLVWLVRGVEIVLDDHDLKFKAVHVFLGVVSVVLAGATVRVARRERAGVGGISPSVGAGR